MSLPDTYRDGRHMARVLTSYIDCPHRVRREVKEYFNDAPCLETIRTMRYRHLWERKQKPLQETFGAYEGYWPGELSRQAEYDNKRFVEALFAEGVRP